MSLFGGSALFCTGSLHREPRRTRLSDHPTLPKPDRVAAYYGVLRPVGDCEAGEGAFVGSGSTSPPRRGCEPWYRPVPRFDSGSFAARARHERTPHTMSSTAR